MRKRVDKQEQVESVDAAAKRAEQENQDTDPHKEHLPTRLQNSTSKKLRNLIMEAASNKSADAIITVDEHFVVRDLNPSAIAELGLGPDDGVGKHCTEILSCKNLNHMQLCGTSSCPLTRALQQGRSLPNEDLLLGDENKHLCEVSANVTPVHVQDSDYAVFTARDMASLKVANQVRANFVSMVSHELRTPLNSVHGFIDLLLQGHMGQLQEEQRIYLSYTQEGVQQLISIVEDILFMTRSDLGQFESRLQEVQLYSLVKQVISSLQPLAMKSGVALYQDVSPALPSLYLDPQRIKQVLNNLLSNAIKFTPPGGIVSVSSRQHDERMQMIAVSDTGYGIPPDDRPHIFERFYQSNHSQQSKMGGYGLGLSIAKLIVEQHGGTLSFETEVDRGTTFYFTVPIYSQRDAT